MSNPWQSPDTSAGDAFDAYEDDDLDFSNLSLGQILFSFEGRIPRSTWWFANIGMALSFYALAFVFGFVGVALGLREDGLTFLILMLYIPLLWCSLAVSVKRWHDRGKSGFWIFIALVPLVGGIWQFVECGLLEGDPYRNEFGPRTT